MQILDQRFLRGPNVHADSPCLLSVVDLQDLYGKSTKDLPAFNHALLELLPSLRGLGSLDQGVWGRAATTFRQHLAEASA